MIFKYQVKFDLADSWFIQLSAFYIKVEKNIKVV